MTSPLNHEETVAYFEEHSFFGLERHQVDFFMQGMLPILDKEGNLFLETPSKMARGPDGNGNALKHFMTSGILDKWEEKGISHVHFVPIDNPLADPFDVELLGHHISQNNEISLKACLRKTDHEKVGLVVQSENHIKVIEYSEMKERELNAKDPKGNFIFNIANLSLFCFSLNFIKRVFKKNKRTLPWHLAWKSVPYVNSQGESIHPKQPNAWKFEYFIFDCLEFTEQTSVIVYPREECFSPLKNTEGENSPATVKQALIQKDIRILEKITESKHTNEQFELSFAFHYPTPELLLKWRGKQIHAEGYIEP